jgi:hypothetical protein
MLRSLMTKSRPEALWFLAGLLTVIEKDSIFYLGIIDIK